MNLSDDEFEHEESKNFTAKTPEVAEEEEDEGEKSRGRTEVWRLDQLAHRVIGAAIEVHRHLGPSFFEECLRRSPVGRVPSPRGLLSKKKLITVGYKETAVVRGKLDFLVIAWS